VCVCVGGEVQRGGADCVLKKVKCVGGVCVGYVSVYVCVFVCEK